MLRRIRLALLTATLASGAALSQSTTSLDLPRPSPKGSVTQNVGLTEVSVAYSSPAVKGRRIWGEVVPFDQVWRAGANECTRVSFSTPVSIEGKPVAAGSYCLFLLPQKSGWTFILSKNTDQAGSGDYKQSEDALRVPAAASAIPHRERMAFTLLDFDDEKGTLAMEWETQRVAVKFTTGTREKVLAQIRALKGDDWRPYNAAARYLLGAGIEPALAMQLADRSIQLKEEWNNVWTRAELLHAAGKNAEALAAAQRAQTLGKASKNFFAADDVAKALVSWKK
ncbi:MAG TPA: DUF2911 domain-containing protein [Myxococcaceae bacterium]|nr:DUF2911 domain-containing protein [Myxococcaceae bacterium]